MFVSLFLNLINKRELDLLKNITTYFQMGKYLDLMFIDVYFFIASVINIYTIYDL